MSTDAHGMPPVGRTRQPRTRRRDPDQTDRPTTDFSRQYPGRIPGDRPTIDGLPRVPGRATPADDPGAMAPGGYRADQTNPRGFRPYPGDQTNPNGFRPAPDQTNPRGFSPYPGDQPNPNGYGPAPDQTNPHGFRPTPDQTNPRGFRPYPGDQTNPNGFRPAPDQTNPNGYRPAPDQTNPRGFRPYPGDQTNPNGYRPATADPSMPNGYPPPRPPNFSGPDYGMPPPSGIPYGAPYGAPPGRGPQGYRAPPPEPREGPRPNPRPEAPTEPQPRVARGRIPDDRAPTPHETGRWSSSRGQWVPADPRDERSDFAIERFEETTDLRRTPERDRPANVIDGAGWTERHDQRPEWHPHTWDDAPTSRSTDWSESPLPQPPNRRVMDPEPERDPVASELMGERVPAGTVTAALAPLIWFGLAIVAYVVALFVFNDSAERAEAIDAGIRALPWLGVASTMSVGLALAFRWIGAGWKAGGLGFAAAVVSGTLTTVLNSLIFG
ncbi:UbiA family prenyltransferase [Virgisporangium aurantiacum]|uniref:UbiA family prenyltransferase n=1 Tax=Virgisporangium aurantiacum TaxID=175570 RepID=UPI00195249C4|nr:UbiA family prenyltransferase [Virgisporangium aurantiacum]